MLHNIGIVYPRSSTKPTGPNLVMRQSSTSSFHLSSTPHIHALSHFLFLILSSLSLLSSAFFLFFSLSHCRKSTSIHPMHFTPFSRALAFSRDSYHVLFSRPSELRSFRVPLRAPAVYASPIYQSRFCTGTYLDLYEMKLETLRNISSSIVVKRVKNIRITGKSEHYVFRWYSVIHILITTFGDFL